jgi:two-component system, chemotaxis family, sensor kinase CheA
MDEFEIELKNDFLNEALDLITEVEKVFIQLENEPENSELINIIFRFAHNLKGTSRAVGFDQISQITHEAENVLLKIKNGQIQVTQYVIDILLQFSDIVSKMVIDLKLDLNSQFSISEIVEKLSDIANGKNKIVPDVQKIPQEIQDMAKEENVIEMHAKKPNQEVLKNELDKKQDVKKEDETIRVSLSRLEKLSNMTGELIILQAEMDQYLSTNTASSKIRRAFNKLCKEIQDTSMSLRMVPIQSTFQKLQRVVRDTSKVLNKKIELKIEGENTEVDRLVLEQLADPLVHIVRNSIDHGIELPNLRLETGKNEFGMLKISAYHQGNNLVIEVCDDGAGIDREKLTAIAKSKKIIDQNQVLSDEQALELIFHPGFSTKEKVTEVSGRGVGMDVVKTNIESLGGTIEISSIKGVGSTFKLILPLTLAIIDGLIVDVANQKIVIPRSQIQEIIKVNTNEIYNGVQGERFIKIRESVLTLNFLSDDFKRKSPDCIICLIIKTQTNYYAVAVDDISGQRQVVVKPAPKGSNFAKGVVGTTILGNGKPVFIFDLTEIYKKTKLQAKYLDAA